MGYQKIINLLDKTSNQLEFKTSILKSSYSDTYIHVKITITIENKGTAATPSNRNKNVIFKSCAPFTNSITEKKTNNKTTKK